MHQLELLVDMMKITQNQSMKVAKRMKLHRKTQNKNDQNQMPDQALVQHPAKEVIWINMTYLLFASFKCFQQTKWKISE